jgi:hypothetical protein
MTEFYRGPHARITDQVFEVQRPAVQSFAISELRNVYVVQGAPSEGAGLAPVRVCSTAVAGVAASIAATAWPVFHSPMMSAVSLIILATSLLVAIPCWWARVRPHQLWGVYRGRLVCLFETTDKLAFGQVSRALLRVFERIDDLA